MIFQFKHCFILFLKRIHPYLQIPLEEGEMYNPQVVFKDLMLKEDLYQGIPDVIHCVFTTFFIGHNESYVESICSYIQSYVGSTTIHLIAISI